jgi:hypothetical protein
LALQIPSGLIVSASGANAPTVIAGPIPIVIVGAAGGLSGLHTITDFSGALNVNISGGSVTTSISGNIVLVTSGGAVQVSGTVTVQTSGGINAFSGGGGATGTVGVGLAALNPGGTNFNIVQLALSGQGALQVATSGAANVVGAVSGNTAFLGESTTNPNLRVSLWNGVRELALNTTADNVNYTSDQVLEAIVLPTAFDGGNNSSRIRTVVGSSGGSLGVLAVQPIGYSYANATGAAITNVKSGAGFLHAININQTGGSGQQLKIYDSASGVGGTTIGTIAGTASGTAAGGSNVVPVHLLYDLLFTSGLVLSTSGAAWDITVTWRTATS